MYKPTATSYSVFKIILRPLSPEKQRPFQEIKVPVPWGHIAGKWWSPYENRPILTVHGWQDNCGSFDRLVPLLSKDVGFIAVDLPGHGHSTKLPRGMYYHHMNYPVLIKQLQEYFGWPKVTLMGHSMGGISCFTYAMLFPETVDYMMCIDGLKPLHIETTASEMAEGIRDLLRYDELLQSTAEPPSYTVNELKEMMSTALFSSIDIEHCHHILNRNIAPSKLHPSKYYFTRDSRLKSKLVLNWPHEQILEGAKRVTCPLLTIKFSESGYFENKQNLYDVWDVIKKVNADCQLHYVEGKHHQHLNNPHVIVDILNSFIAKHNKGDRSVGKKIKQIMEYN